MPGYGGGGFGRGGRRGLGGGVGIGPGGECLCPNCGHRVPHQEASHALQKNAPNVEN